MQRYEVKSHFVWKIKIENTFLMIYEFVLCTDNIGKLKPMVFWWFQVKSIEVK